MDNGDFYGNEGDYRDNQSVMPPQKEEKESNEIGVIRELSPKKVLEQLRMNLKGFEWNNQEKKYELINDPLMNDDGIRKYIVVMHAVITDLVTFSNYKDEEVARLTYYVCEKSIPTIHLNWKEYGVKDKADLELIDIQILSLTYAALKKAVGAGDRGVIGRTISENIMSRTGNMQSMGGGGYREEKRGFFSRLNPFARNG